MNINKIEAALKAHEIKYEKHVLEDRISLVYTGIIMEYDYGMEKLMLIEAIYILDFMNNGEFHCGSSNQTEQRWYPGS